MQRRSRPRAFPAVDGRNLLVELDEFHKALGEIANAWAGMEDCLCVLFSHLAETDWETSTILFYSPSSFRARLEMIANLQRHKMPDCLENQLLTNAIAKLNDLNTKRNALVHGRWGMTSEHKPSGKRAGWVSRENVQPRKKDMRATTKPTLSEMDDHLDSLGALYQCLYFFGRHSPGYPCPIKAWAATARISPSTTSP